MSNSPSRSFSKSIGKIVKGTLWLKVDSNKPESDKIRAAATVIRKGGLVSFPTETVYGLGADALNPKAVEKIFAAKQRPPDNPIIVHVADKKDAERLAKEIPEVAEKLMSRFWPGPLTLILKRSPLVPGITVVGLDTIAVRMPRNKVALALIRASGVPIAAPSANLAGKPSPTKACHVIDDLAGRIDVVLDAGPTKIGVESTVVDLTTSVPMILRPGGTSYETLKRAVGKVELHPTAIATKKILVRKAPSPGMKHRHYAPNAEMIVVEGDHDKIVSKVLELASFYKSEGRKVGILASSENVSKYEAFVVKSFGNRNNLTVVARNLFGVLRELDKERVDVIVAEGVPSSGLGLAVMNRMRRAANYNIRKAS